MKTISLIKFAQSNLFIPRAEAVDMNLLFLESDENRLGWKDGKVVKCAPATSEEHYNILLKSDCIWVTELPDEEGNMVAIEKPYYAHPLTKKKHESYYLADPLTEAQLALDYVELIPDPQIVEIAEFAPKCRYEYKILRSFNEDDSSFERRIDEQLCHFESSRDAQIEHFMTAVEQDLEAQENLFQRINRKAVHLFYHSWSNTVWLAAITTYLVFHK